MSTIQSDVFEQFRSRPWANLPDLEVFMRAKRSLLTLTERKMLYWLTKEHFTGEGAIVDLGSFLGSSTVAMAAGLAERESNSGHVHAYDLFEVSRDKETQKLLNKAEGNSFLDNFQDTIRGYEERITTNAGDVTKFPWTGGPIEILFVDLAKSWELNEYIIGEFFPHLIPEKSIIIHQDFGNSWNPWIPVSMGYLEDLFPMLCDESLSRVYLRSREPETNQFKITYKKDLDKETRLACMEKSLQLSEGIMSHRLHGAMAILRFIEDGKEAGLEYIDTVVSKIEMAEYERNFMKIVRETIDIWTKGDAYEKEMATKF